MAEDGEGPAADRARFFDRDQRPGLAGRWRPAGSGAPGEPQRADAGAPAAACLGDEDGQVDAAPVDRVVERCRPVEAELDVKAAGGEAERVAGTRPRPPLLSVSRSIVDFSTVGGVLTSLNGGENWFGVGTSDKTLNTLSEEIESASSQTQRDTIADQVQQYVLQQGYFIPVVQLVQRICLPLVRQELAHRGASGTAPVLNPDSRATASA